MSVANHKVLITDTTLRDAHQSLIATRLKTEDMILLARQIDRIGFFSVEAWGGATFDTSIRFLAEDPWERLQLLKQELTHTPIQMLLRGQNLVGYRHYPDDVVDRFVEMAYKNGVDIFRVFDALNDIRNMTESMKMVKKMGAHLQGTISYTTSPVHSTIKFIQMAEELYALDCDSVCIKDMAGLIMPDAARELIVGIKDAIDIKVDLHSHSTSGIAPMSYQAAIEAGVDILDTAMSPFALGTSQPPTESVVAALKSTPRDTGLDLLALREVRNTCLSLRQKYQGLINPISEQVDSDVLIYQLPGGMISNLVSQPPGTGCPGTAFRGVCGGSQGKGRSRVSSPGYPDLSDRWHSGGDERPPGWRTIPECVKRGEGLCQGALWQAPPANLGGDKKTDHR